MRNDEISWCWNHGTLNVKVTDVSYNISLSVTSNISIRHSVIRWVYPCHCDKTSLSSQTVGDRPIWLYNVLKISIRKWNNNYVGLLDTEWLTDFTRHITDNNNCLGIPDIVIISVWLYQTQWKQLSMFTRHSNNTCLTLSDTVIEHV